MEGASKAVSIYKQLGENLPMEVFNHLSSEEIERLLEKLSSPQKISKKGEDTIVLKEFVDSLSSRKTARKPIPSGRHSLSLNEFSHDEDRLIEEIQELLIEEEKDININPTDTLSTLSVETISKLLVDESPQRIAAILFFSPDEVSKILISGLHPRLKESVIFEMGEMDFHSFQLRDDLDRFLQFKLNMIASLDQPNLQKARGRESKKAAHLLNHLNPKESAEILSKLQKKRPEYAENIIEHYYSFSDLLLLGRKSLSEFIGSFHPLVVATALKGIESELEEEILSLIEPWIAREIRLESNSIGSVSLAEIEETHQGILNSLRVELEAGRLKLWRFR